MSSSSTLDPKNLFFFILHSHLGILSIRTNNMYMAFGSQRGCEWLVLEPFKQLAHPKFKHREVHSFHLFSKTVAPVRLIYTWLIITIDASIYTVLYIYIFTVVGDVIFPQSYKMLEEWWAGNLSLMIGVWKGQQRNQDSSPTAPSHSVVFFVETQGGSKLRDVHGLFIFHDVSRHFMTNSFIFHIIPSYWLPWMTPQQWRFVDPFFAHSFFCLSTSASNNFTPEHARREWMKKTGQFEKAPIPIALIAYEYIHDITISCPTDVWEQLPPQQLEP